MTLEPLVPVNRPLWCGYYFKHSDRPGYGDWPDAPGNCEVIVEPSVVTRVPGPILITPDCLSAAASTWARVVAVYVIAESASREEIDLAVALVRSRMAAAGLPRRPVVVYTGGTTVPGTTADWIGLQAYFDAPLDPPQYLAFIQAEIAKVGAQPVALICQSYDRASDLWRQHVAALETLQQTWPLAAATWDQIVALLLFSCGRLGGAATYPSLQASHAVMMTTIQTPAIEDLPALPVSHPPGITVVNDHYPRLFGPDLTLVEWEDRNNPGCGCRVTMEDGSVHVEQWNPAGRDKTGKRREIREAQPSDGDTGSMVDMT